MPDKEVAQKIAEVAESKKTHAVGQPRRSQDLFRNSKNTHGGGSLLFNPESRSLWQVSMFTRPLFKLKRSR